MKDSEEGHCDLMVQVVFSRAGGDEAIVHVILESVAIFGVQGGKDVVHELLHGGRAICWAKGHDSGGIEACCGFERQKVL